VEEKRLEAGRMLLTCSVASHPPALVLWKHNSHRQDCLPSQESPALYFQSRLKRMREYLSLLQSQLILGLRLKSTSEKVEAHSEITIILPW
jgi:hypothetical protein